MTKKYLDNEFQSIVRFFFHHVFRTSVDKPGYALLDLGNAINSLELRKYMIALKHEIDQLCRERFDKKLAYQWLTRFDQQESTKLHQDNAGDQSFLMLGYEPTDILSELYIADYVKFCYDQQLQPAQFFEKFNPLFKDQYKKIKPYITKIQHFKKDHYQIVLINNSNSVGKTQTLGLLHQAKMIKNHSNKSRVVNSMMLNMINRYEHQFSNIDEQEFKTTDKINR